MKRVVLLLSLISFVIMAQAQNLRISAARKYEDKLQFANALSIWKDLSTNSELLNSLSPQDWKSAFCCAYFSEDYKAAVAFSKHLRFKSIVDNRIDELFLSAVIRTNMKDSIAPYFLDSLAFYKGDARWKMIQEERFDFVRSNVNATGKFKVSPLRDCADHEEFGLFPLGEEKFFFVTDQFEDGLLHRKDGRSGNNFYGIAFSNSPELMKEERWKEVELNQFHAGPVFFTPSGSKVFITVNDVTKMDGDKLKKHTLDLLSFYKAESGWQTTQLPFNSPDYSTGHGVLDTLGNLIFASDMPGGMGGTDLYMARYENGNWIEPKNLGPSINSGGNELFPFVSPSGVLYFSSDGWQGLGGLDVFSWSSGELTPTNLLAPLNSSSDDFSYWVNEDAGRGYFSSNRTNSKDKIYRFEYPPFKVNFKIQAQLCDNVPLSNDSVFVRDLNSGYMHALVTNAQGLCYFTGKENGAYEFSIRSSKSSKPVSSSFIVEEQGEYIIELRPVLEDQVVCFKVVNERGQPIQGALVEMFKKSSKKVKKKYLTDKSGRSNILRSELAGLDSIKVSFINHSDFTWKNKVEQYCDDTLMVEVKLIKNNERDYINLDLILYDYDKYNLRPISKVELDKLVGYMKKHPGMKVELSSHTDCRGTAEYNERLSQNRSNSCVNYIISKGIASELIIAKGYGEYRLKNRCADGVECTEEEHQQNRRTELHILLNEGE
jgi:outer membrane protein OmpA-like peptidoglycan-associated protein